MLFFFLEGGSDCECICLHQIKKWQVQFLAKNKYNNNSPHLRQMGATKLTDLTVGSTGDMSD